MHADPSRKTAKHELVLSWDKCETSMATRDHAAVHTNDLVLALSPLRQEHFMRGWRLLVDAFGHGPRPTRPHAGGVAGAVDRQVA
jgi:hypothetical protein